MRVVAQRVDEGGRGLECRPCSTPSGGEGVGHGRHAMRGRNDCTVTRVWRRCCVAAQPLCLGELPVECGGESSSLVTSVCSRPQPCRPVFLELINERVCLVKARGMVRVSVTVVLHRTHTVLASLVSTQLPLSLSTLSATCYPGRGSAPPSEPGTSEPVRILPPPLVAVASPEAPMTWGDP